MSRSEAQSAHPASVLDLFYKSPTFFCIAFRFPPLPHSTNWQKQSSSTSPQTEIATIGLIQAGQTYKIKINNVRSNHEFVGIHFRGSNSAGKRRVLEWTRINNLVEHHQSSLPSPVPCPLLTSPRAAIHIHIHLIRNIKPHLKLIYTLVSPDHAPRHFQAHKVLGQVSTKSKRRI